MNSPVNISLRMEYIQKLFLEVEGVVEKLSEPEEILTYLDREEPLFRSVGYESASFVIGVKDLSQRQSLDRWKNFRRLCAGEHTFHSDIGLGWAFAKTGIQPLAFSDELGPAIEWMVYDGIGYYYGLFKGRNTIRQRLVPPEISTEVQGGFDEGLGRRLWYMAKGNVEQLLPLVQSFDENRQTALWQGIGIACGYVGGNSVDEIATLIQASGAFEKSFSTGIMLATISRIESRSMNEDTLRAFRKVCKMELEDLNMADLSSADIYNVLNKEDAGLWSPLMENLPPKRIIENGLIEL
jgi:enediyne biosynthesis protein E3